MKTITFLLLCCILTTTSQAQQTETKVASSWKTASSLIGISLSDAGTILRKAGFENLAHEKNPIGLEDYFYYPPNLNDKEGEPHHFYVGSKKEKVKIVSITFEYEGANSIFNNNVAELKKILEENGFIQNAKKTHMGVDTYFFQSGNKSMRATLRVAGELVRDQYILLELGDPKFVRSGSE